MKCKNCGGELKHRDWVKRLVKYGYGDQEWIRCERKLCIKCGKLYRILPEFAVPYKHYCKDIIDEAINSKDDLGYEDFPSNMTIKRWRNHRSSY